MSDELPFFLVAEHDLQLELLDLLLEGGVAGLQVHALILHFHVSELRVLARQGIEAFFRFLTCVFLEKSIEPRVAHVTVPAVGSARIGVLVSEGEGRRL